MNAQLMNMAMQMSAAFPSLPRLVFLNHPFFNHTLTELLKVSTLKMY